MSYQSDFDEEVLKEKLRILLDEDNEKKKWHEGLLIKSLILLPIIIFIVGSFSVNRPENIIDVILILLYPFTLIFMGLMILFFMRSNLK